MDADVMVMVLLVLSVIGTGVNTVLIVVLWLRHESKREQIQAIERRLLVVEDRIGGIGELRDSIATVQQAVGALGQIVAALNERSSSTLDMLQSIQEFLRQGST